ncbi:T9SS type B sorting domain-containing protein [Pedobacter sp. HMF7647]|uniref:T9SS type B sorting domain-containing protein n=1 Tax=Hufsiella arboris TaxID=2695275 RepID=A0A7K1YCQ9_9SPHI|nr:PKD domain-containing protein [Hufsiella arboris]MXV52366.1 T9SS type B sorting domain-containing protein [Hufsiella arboris]
MILSAVLCISLQAAFAQPANDDCAQATSIPSGKQFCSANGAYSTDGATESFIGSGNDVWFSFVPRDGYDLYITVAGAGDGGTLQSPKISLFSDCTLSNGLLGTTSTQNNSTTFYRGGLIIGQRYLISVSGANSGSFSVCVTNSVPNPEPGHDCSTATYLCSKEQVKGINIHGIGTNINEGSGTCLDVAGGNAEINSAFYKWTAANDGSLVFTITPFDSKTGDIDWVLYDLGTSDNCANLNAAHAIRCAAGWGVGCTPFYYLTGLSFSENDLNEQSGCSPTQNGFLKAVDMQAGHVYALLVNIFQGNDNGFSIDFTDPSGKAGTGEFLGPNASFDMAVNNECLPNQSYTFTSTSTNTTRLVWNFGEGADIQTSANGTETVHYNTLGTKTVVLEAHNDLSCFTIASKTFEVGLKPPTPQISLNKTRFCLGDSIVLSTNAVTGAVYNWTGPNNFTSAQQSPVIPVSSYQIAGTYTLTVAVGNCVSDAASIVVPVALTTPVPNFEINTLNPCTNSQSFQINNNSVDFTSIDWDFGEGASTRTARTNGPFNLTYTIAGDKVITLTMQNNGNCPVVLTKILHVDLVPPTPKIVINKPDFCLKDTIHLSTDLLPNTTYTWTGPNNFVSDQPSPAIPVTSESVAGVYNLFIKQGNCSSEIVSVTVPPIYKNPVASFTSSPALPAKLSNPALIQFFNQSTEADSYLWDFGDGSTSTEINPQHLFQINGEYEVTLTAFKSNVCFASIIQGKFVIRADNTTFIPNTFTPNGDGVNDEFVINVTNLANYHISIFNRYGVEMFQTGNIFDNWKGTYNNQPLPTGTYYYVIKAKDLGGNPVVRSGYVALIY